MYPVIPHWKVTVVFHVLDEVVTEKVFSAHIKEAGRFIGIGRWRVRNNGLYGRFQVNSITWENAE